MSEPIDPNYSDRFFAEKIISRDYKRLLVVMTDSESDTHVWSGYDGVTSDILGLARIATLQAEENFGNAPGKKFDSDTGDEIDP